MHTRSFQASLTRLSEERRRFAHFGLRLDSCYHTAVQEADVIGSIFLKAFWKLAAAEVEQT